MDCVVIALYADGFNRDSSKTMEPILKDKDTDTDTDTDTDSDASTSSETIGIFDHMRIALTGNFPGHTRGKYYLRLAQSITTSSQTLFSLIVFNGVIRLICHVVLLFKMLTLLMNSKHH